MPMDTHSIRYESIHGRHEESGIAADTTRIDLSMRGITSIDLTPIQNCNQLRTLDLSKNHIAELDVTPLSTISTLERLKLKGNELLVLDLWPLRNLTNIEEIDLTQNRLGSINLTSVIRQTCVSLDETTFVELDYTLRYLLGGKDSTRIQLCNSSGAMLDKSPRMYWKKFDDLFALRGWGGLRASLEHYIESMERRNWFRLQKGILEGFGFDELAGYDGNPQDLLQGVPSSGDYQVIRNAVYDRTIESLEKQITMKGSTLFLDVQKMVGTRASKLIPMVVSAREEEMRDVSVLIGGNRVNLLPLWLTHYGAELLRVLKFGLTTDTAGLDLISRNLEQLGHTLSTRQVEFDAIETPKGISEGLVDFIYSIASMN